MADYPREVYLDEETEERLVSYIESVLQDHYAERSPHIDDLVRYQKDYWAQPITTQATFPFRGAAVIIIPLSAIAIEAVHSRNMTMSFGMPQLVSAKAKSAAFSSIDRHVERFMDYELVKNIRIRKPLNDCYLEATKFGTMVAKTGYEKQVKYAVREVAGYEETFPVTVKDGAVVSAVPDSRFLMPYSATSVAASPWVGEEHSATPYEVMQWEQGGMFRPGTIISDDPDPLVNNSALGAWINNHGAGTAGEDQGRKFEENQQRLEKTTPAFPERINWVELKLSFDVDGSNQEKEIVVHYHRDARYFMSIRYNWYSDLHREYRVGVYFPVEHRWRGIGICKMNEQFQRETTAQHRQRLDNGTLANMRMLIVHKLSGYGAKEPIFPGKMWFVDDMTHIQSLQMGEIYPSSYQNEQSTLLYSQQRTGVNEMSLGMPQAGTPGTATSDLARIQEGNRKSDFVYANFTEFTEDIITDVAAVIQQFGPHKISYYEEVEGGKLVQQFFEMPQALIRDGLLIELKRAGQSQNKVMDRQKWQELAIHMQAYYQGLVQLAMPLGDQQIMQTILVKGMGAATEAMRQILETSDVRNIDRLIVTEIEGLISGSQGAGAVPGGNGGPPVAGQPSGMDAVTQAFAAVAGGGQSQSRFLSGGGGGV